MVFGILGDHKLDNVPGTGLLSDRVNVDSAMIDGKRYLKRGTGKYSHIILIPQPSDDPRDPLNWPRWKKEACFWTLIVITTLKGALHSIATAGYLLLAKKFDTSVDSIASSFSAYLPALAVSLLLQNTLAVRYGHRVVYLLSTFLMFIACCWTALSRDLMSIRISRVFQGFGMAASEALVPSTLEHIYFVHERGSRSAIWNFSETAGLIFSPFIYGYIIQKVSWQLGFWLVSIAYGLSFITVFFFVPETMSHLQAPATLSQSHQDKRKDSHDMDTIKEMSQTPIDPRKHVDRLDAPHSESFFSQLKIYNGTFSNKSPWKIFTSQFALILSPVASATWFLFSFLMQTACFSVLSICSSTILTIEYHFNAAQIGLMHLGGLVGVILAMLITGPLSDRTIIWMSQRNHGVYEPEYRLVFMLGALFGVFGFMGWAVGSDHHMPWVGAAACFAMVPFGLIFTGGAATTYLLDTHGPNAIHVLSVTNFAKSLFIYGSTFFANHIVISHGVKVSLLILGACQAIFGLASIPVYMYGKRVRSFIVRNSHIFPEDSTGKLASNVSQSAQPDAKLG